MHFLADENLPQTIIKYLKKEGHTVIDIKKENPAVSDRELVNRKVRSSCLIFPGQNPSIYCPIFPLLSNI